MNETNKNNLYTLDCAGHPVRLALTIPGTRRLFGEYLTEAEGETFDIRLTRDYMEENRWIVTPQTRDDFLEFQTLMLATANHLLAHDRALFHGVSFLWRGRAWIITAPSGTGKTTQLRHWLGMLPREVQVINGDKALLECRADGTVWVHSSPWRGKERIGVPRRGGPLGGVILLEQGEENIITRLSPADAVFDLFVEFISIPETVEQIRLQRDILEKMLDAAPVWKLINRGDEASARLTQDTLAAYLEETHGEL